MQAIGQKPPLLPRYFTSFVNRIGATDILKHLHPFLSHLEQVSLILSKGDTQAWGRSVRRLDLRKFQKKNEAQDMSDQLNGKPTFRCKVDTQIIPLLRKAPLLQELVLPASALVKEDYDKLAKLSIRSLILESAACTECRCMSEQFRLTGLALIYSVDPEFFLQKQDKTLLTHLDLRDTAIPYVQFDQFPALENLVIEQAKIDDAQLKQIANLSSLRSLTLARTTLSGGGNLKSIGSLTNLECLKLENIFVEEDDFLAIARLAKLKLFDYTPYCTSSPNVLDTFLEMFPDDSALEVLHLKNCQGITGKGIKALQRLSRLRTLSLMCIRGTSVESLESLANLPQLQTLFLYSAAIPECLHNFLSLNTLILDSLSYSPSGAVALAKIPRLRHLQLNAGPDRINSWCSLFKQERKRLQLPEVIIKISKITVQTIPFLGKA